MLNRVHSESNFILEENDHYQSPIMNVLIRVTASIATVFKEKIKK